jgi:hypothetical protein
MAAAPPVVISLSAAYTEGRVPTFSQRVPDARQVTGTPDHDRIPVMGQHCHRVIAAALDSHRLDHAGRAVTMRQLRYDLPAVQGK